MLEWIGLLPLLGLQGNWRGYRMGGKAIGGVMSADMKDKFEQARASGDMASVKTLADKADAAKPKSTPSAGMGVEVNSQRFKYKTVDVVAVDPVKSRISQKEIEERVDAQLKTGIVTSPIIMHEYAPDKFRVLHGQDAFAAAQVAKSRNIDRAEMVNAFVLDIKSSKQEINAVVRQVRMDAARAKREAKKTSKPLTEVRLGSVLQKFVDVAAIDQVKGTKKPKDLDRRVDSYLQTGKMTSPIVVHNYAPEKYRVVHGQEDFAVAQAAKAKNPARAEMVNAFMLSINATPDEVAAVVAQAQRGF